MIIKDLLCKIRLTLELERMLNILFTKKANLKTLLCKSISIKLFYCLAKILSSKFTKVQKTCQLLTIKPSGSSKSSYMMRNIEFAWNIMKTNYVPNHLTSFCSILWGNVETLFKIKPAYFNPKEVSKIINIRGELLFLGNFTRKRGLCDTVEFH